MNQLRILHLSDVHFGPHHRCSPEDPSHPRAGYPSLFELLARDLKEGPFGHSAWQPSDKAPNPLLVAVSGDLTETADSKEFGAAHAFLSRFEGASILNTALTKKDVFIVPGNHDVDYTADDAESRLSRYANFYTKFYKNIRTPIHPDESEGLSQVHVDTDRGLVVVEINSAYYVQKGTADAQRGCVDMRAIKRIRAGLAAIPADKRKRMIRIAILHHHPILVPALVEPGRGYDAVVNSHHLLQLLRDFGFHLVLHGHKHYPHIFSYDTDSPWGEPSAPMLVVAGGSSASRELPAGRRCNTYNLISVKWHPDAGQARVRFLTRGLISEDGSGELAPDLWKWTTLREVDRRLYPSCQLPEPVKISRKPGIDRAAETKRSEVYAATRGNMVVSEVLPSLLPGQAYEVRAWIVPHVDRDGQPKPGWEPPQQVLWSAGEMFDRKEVLRSEDPTFCAAFHYWGPMLLQAEIRFADGQVGYGYTYARIPELTPRASDRA